MDHKFLAVLLFFILFSSLVLPTSISASQDWLIDGTTVYIDDSRVYLSADPHTIASPGWVTFTLTSKQYTGDIDVVWGFPQPNVKPTKAQRYAHYWNNWTTEHSKEFYYVQSFTQTEETCDYAYTYNTHHYNVSHYVPEYDEWGGNVTGWLLTSSIACFDTWEQNGSNYTVSWQQRHSEYIEWVDFNGGFDVLHIDYQGMNTWYLLKNVPVVAGETYILRAWVDVPISTTATEGKYWWALKPSALSLNDAIEQEKFYALDPWYNAQWSHRVQWTVTNPTDEELVNYPVYINVTVEAEMQADGDDIVFTDASSNVYNFEQDYIDAAHADYWLNVTSIPASSFVSGYMYYGNDAAASQEDVEGTWDANYVMVQHMSDGVDNAHITDSTQYDNDGTKKAANEPNEVVGAIGMAQDFGGSYYISLPNSESLNILGTELTLEALIHPQSVVGRKSIISKNYKYIDFGSTQYIMDVFYQRILFTVAGSSFQTGVLLSAGEWAYAACTYEKDINSIIYIDGINRASSIISSSIIEIDKESSIGCHYQSSRTAFFNDSLDEIRISNVARSVDWIKASYLFVNNQSDYVTWGDELNWSNYTCPPENLTYDLYNYGANFSWDAVSSTSTCCNATSFNISVTNGQNTTWHNGTTNTSFNVSSYPCTYIHIEIWGYNAGCENPLSYEPLAASLLTNCGVNFTNCPSCLPVDGCGCIYYDFNVTDTGAFPPFFNVTPDVGTLNNSTGVFTWCQNLSDWLNTTGNLSFSVQLEGYPEVISYCNVTIGCMDSFIYLQNLRLVEEQEMLADMWLYLIFALVAIVLLFASFFVQRGDYYVHIIMAVFSMLLMFLLALYSPTEEIAHPELSYIFIFLGMIALIAIAIYIVEAVQDVWPMTAKAKANAEEKERQKAEERYWNTGW